MAVDRERRHQKHRQMIMVQYEGICHICNEPYADAIDHVVPVAKGGSDHPDNLRPAHTTCNSKKGARSYPSWAEENPNMWEPEYLPEITRAIEEEHQRQVAAKQERQQEEARLRQEQERREYAEAKKVWDEKQAVMRLKERQKPTPPIPNQNPLAIPIFGFFFVAVVIGLAVWMGDAFPGGLLLLAFFCFIAWWVGAVTAVVVMDYGSRALKKTVFRARQADYETRLAAWEEELENIQQTEPLSMPVDPENKTQQGRSKYSRRRYYRHRGYYKRRY